MSAGDRFVNVPAEAMFAFLESKGFTRSQQGRRSRREVVYERGHERDARYRVLVYTSIAMGAAVARRKGADAIRIVPLFDNGRPGESRGLGKLTKVLRTAPQGEPGARVNHVLERVLGRMREAYAVCSKRIAERR